jgi:hypothetical protein
VKEWPNVIQPRTSTIRHNESRKSNVLFLLKNNYPPHFLKRTSVCVPPSTKMSSSHSAERWQAVSGEEGKSELTERLGTCCVGNNTRLRPLHRLWRMRCLSREARDSSLLTNLLPVAGQASAHPLRGGNFSSRRNFIKEILSLSICAELLGTTVRSPRHYLTKDQVVPYRQLNLGGNTHVRYFAAEDFETMQEWWTQRHAPKEEPNHGGCRDQTVFGRDDQEPHGANHSWKPQ